jgi:2-aminoadipate transaminase
LEKGWQEAHLARLKATYQRRLQVMEAALNHHLSQVARFATPAGGFYFWLAMPEAVDTADLLDKAHTHQVGFRPGVYFSGRGQLRNYMRLSFAFYDEADIKRGVERLGNVIVAGL